MSKPTHRLAAIVAAAALSVTFSACTAEGWEADAPPAAGVQADDGGIKLRNFLVVSDTEGAAVLLGGIASRDESTQVTGITVAAEGSDGQFGQSEEVQFSEEISKGRTIYLDGTTTAFTDPALLLGRLAKVTVDFSTGESVTLEAPVLSSEHPDFSEAWAQAQPS
ncbi:hypothetical protein SAMN02745244_00100 [Tessaracoccus bendigoensis DSM 12906]|uniref:Lipoprotein n=1 Tax=Tessaracoccus bendigoensis DSM 12906 TaxID=1123357 RepID=A0A1M6A4T5_9ACTN|nr:hypothetical protein [Tessaracoccus bendigoensis]SHI31447.1 hypothetical protein SAMN02745244_00100 [Tessaracoccus bendigoensis DSM 12906]